MVEDEPEAPPRMPHDGVTDHLTVAIERAKRLLPMDKAARGQGDVGPSDPYAKLDYVDSEGQRQSLAVSSPPRAYSVLQAK